MFSFDGTVGGTSPRNNPISRSTHIHRYIFGRLGSYLGQPFVTGGWDNHHKTEIMNMDTLQWEDGPDYDLHNER